MAVSIATVLLAASPLHLFGGSWGGLIDTTAMTLLALGVGAYAAGRRLTSTAAARAGYDARDARTLVALIGSAVVAAYSLIGWRGALDWPSALLLLSLPIWFTGGAWHATARAFPTRRWQLQVLGVAFLVVPIALALGMGTVGNGSGGNSFQPAGVEKIARPQPESIGSAITASGGPLGNGVATIDAEFDDPAVLAGWSDLRIEAWRGIRTAAEYPGAWSLDPGATAPFATAPAVLESANPSSGEPARLQGSVAIDRDPTVHLAWLAITGVAPDGQRYVVDGLSFATTTFNGTGLDWLAAVASGR